MMSGILELLLIFVTWNARKFTEGLLSEAIYNRNEIASNVVPTNTQHVFIRSLTDCAMLCQASATCDVFYHSTDTQTCYIYSSSGNSLSYTADSSASCFSKPASSTPAPPTTAATTTSTQTTTPLITTTTTTSTMTSPQSTTTTTSLVTTTTTATTTAALTTSSTPMMTTTTTQTTTPTTTPQVTTTITTTTATATPPNWNPTTVTILNCPSTFTSDVTIPSVYGIFKLRIVHTSVAQAAADTACSNIGMQLFKPDNENKVNEVANVLYSCVVYDRYGYWTDAKRQSGGGNTWTTSDGEAIPTNAWCNSQVGNDASDNCSRLGMFCNYKLKDKECSYVHPSWGYICELL